MDHPIGTGPYTFVEWARGEKIEFTAFPEWWGNTYPEAALGAQSIQDVTYIWRPESSVRAAQVIAGEAQLGRFLSPEDCATTLACKEAISVETVPLRLDTVYPVLNDIRVRKAITYAIDKQAVVDELFASGAVANQLVGPSATGYNAEMAQTPYDPDLARQLVAEAAADGVPVELPLIIAVRQGVYLRAEELGETRVAP